MKTVDFTTVDDEGYERKIRLPAVAVVCDRCNGEGTHVNPAIDGHGLTWEEIDELGGDEFMDDYLGGVYDVSCEECNGERIIWNPDTSRANPDDLKLWEEHLQEEYEYRAMVEAERRMGA